MKTKKEQLANALTNIKFGNWMLTGFKGDKDATKESIFKICMKKTVRELELAIENITIV